MWKAPLAWHRNQRVDVFQQSPCGFFLARPQKKTFVFVVVASLDSHAAWIVGARPSSPLPLSLL
jgi:hypothetical protein